MEIVSAFGPLAAYRFLSNSELGGPCAFLEYADRSITSKACAGLNGMMLGGCVLTAVHVFPNPPPVEAANEASPFYGIPDNAKSLLKEPTKVLQLKNVFEQEEYMLLSKSELEETLEDVRLECMRFGAVKSVNVVEYLAGGGGAAEDNIVELKIECTEFTDTENIAKAVSEYSVPVNQSIDVLNHSEASETKDIDLIPESQDQKDILPSNATLCESKVPVADEDAELDETQSRAAHPTSQNAEAGHTEAAVDENEHTVGEVTATVMDDNAVEKSHEDSRTSETCNPAEPTDEVEKPGVYSEQGADDVTEDRPEKVPAVETIDTGFVFEPGSVLVEFMRKEAACIAAHSLHGRCFGNRTVQAGYAPYDLYLQKYPR